jgi:hypothetical protein
VYKAILKDNKWSDFRTPFNSDNYNVAHPALSQDENIYFVSDIGTVGQSDLSKYKLTRMELKWNLLVKINTEQKLSLYQWITSHFASDDILTVV